MEPPGTSRGHVTALEVVTDIPQLDLPTSTKAVYVACVLQRPSSVFVLKPVAKSVWTPTPHLI